jgi:hypothetical protein
MNCPICSSPVQLLGTKRVFLHTIAESWLCSAGHKFKVNRSDQFDGQSKDDYDDAIEEELRAERGW